MFQSGFFLSLVLSVFLLLSPPGRLVRHESGRGCRGSREVAGFLQLSGSPLGRAGLAPALP